MATPVLTHALEQFPTEHPLGRPASRRIGRLHSGFLIGATAALTVTVLPGTAAADPDRATTPEQAIQLVTEADHELEVVTEQLNEAKVVLEQQQAAVAAAEQTAAEAQARLDALDGQIRQLARTAYTGDSFSELDVMLSSDSAEEFLHQLGTLNAIAGHTNDLVTEIAVVSENAVTAKAAADKATAEAQAAVDSISAQQAELEKKIEDYQRQYAALTAPQQEEVSRAHAGEAVPVPSGVIAPSQAAQVAVDTALAQQGKPYVWGGTGPSGYDCSGLTSSAYQAAGVQIPRTSKGQSTAGAPVDRANLQPGDLIFFYNPVGHVAMYIGNGQMVHSSTYGQPVKVVPVDSMYGYNTARRVV